jgi:hypothetical protein
MSDNVYPKSVLFIFTPVRLQFSIDTFTLPFRLVHNLNVRTLPISYYKLYFE